MKKNVQEWTAHFPLTSVLVQSNTIISSPQCHSSSAVMVLKQMWHQNQPGAQFMAHWAQREKRQLHFLQFHMKPQTKLIMIITTFINSLSHRWVFLTLPLFLRQISSSGHFFSPSTTHVSPPLSRFTRIKGNKNIMTSSQAGNCSHVFWTIMSTVLCLDPWKWPAVNSKVKEGNVSAEFYMHIYMNIYRFRFSSVCVCMCVYVCVWQKQSYRPGAKGREAAWERAGTSSGI